MEIASFDGANTVFGPPQGMIESGPQSTGEEPQVPSASGWSNGRICLLCYKPTYDEIEEIRRTGRIWVMTLGTPCPMRLTSERPEIESYVFEDEQ